MRRHLLVFLALSAALVTGGCLYPVAMSPECKAKVDACLKGCPDDDFEKQTMSVESPGLNLNDTTTPCEQQCYRLCSHGK